ncbi:uncharacterized protein GIQ15_05561 [Arthroderma uncinatum]|uniref:uncharacterized protein n=1 Tax=Arthroderma uncinatum TaxID=74035 RepID=UPI00144A553B|nr:uncharacterized protein GIQ15_05561 [Arthroderma uncinatum]KAF3480214.1 hypothetical protein GIQ15_05561 [Arthroderma uncinatum]
MRHLRLLYLIYGIVAVLQNLQVSAWSIPREYLGVYTSSKAPITHSLSPDEEAIKRAPPPIQPGQATATNTNTAASGEDATENRVNDDAIFKRLMSDLETCVEDLLPYTTENTPNDQVQISGSKVRSCRQAIFSLIRWLGARGNNPPKGSSSVVGATDEYQESHQSHENERRDDQKSRFNLVKPGNNRDPRESGRLETRVDETGNQPTPTNTRPLTCHDRACTTDDILSTCVTKKGAKLKPKVARMCKMCFPRRNEQLVDVYCSELAKKEWYLFYILFAILITAAGTFIALTFLRRLRAKAQNTQDGGAGILPIKRSIRPPTLGMPRSRSRGIASRCTRMAIYLRASATQADVEERLMLDAKAYLSTPTHIPPAQVSKHKQYPFQGSGAEACERQTGLKFRKSCDSNLEVPAAAAQRGRSSSVQTIPNVALATGNEGVGLQRLSVDTPVQRPHTAD